MPDGQKSICRHCEDKEAELYIKQEFELQELKVDFARLWTQCQRCQGNMQEKVICSNSGMYCWLQFYLSTRLSTIVTNMNYGFMTFRLSDFLSTKENSN